MSVSEIGDIITQVKNAIQEATGFFGQIANIISAPFQALGMAIASGLAWFGSFIFSALKSIWDTLSKIFQPFIDWVSGFTKSVQGFFDYISKAFQNFLTWVWSGLQWLIYNIINAIIWVIQSVYNYIVLPVVNAVIGFLRAVYTFIGVAYNMVVGVINSFVRFILIRVKERLTYVLTIDAVMLYAKRKLRSSADKGILDTLSMVTSPIGLVGSAFIGAFLGAFISSLLPSVDAIQNIKVIPEVDLNAINNILPYVPAIQLPYFTQTFQPSLPPEPTHIWTQLSEIDLSSFVNVYENISFSYQLPPVFTTNVGYSEVMNLALSLFEFDSQVKYTESGSTQLLSYELDSQAGYTDSVSIS